MGRITDPGTAKDLRIPCHGFVIAPGKTVEDIYREIRDTGVLRGEDVFLFKQGVQGALSNAQDETICDVDILRLETTPPKLQFRLDLMRGLKEGKYACMDRTSKAATIIFLRQRARETRDEKELALLDKAILEIADIPTCED
jgi:hypothetical protein